MTDTINVAIVDTPKVSVAVEKMVPRKVFGIPMFAFLMLSILATGAAATVAYFSLFHTDITLGAAGTFTSGTPASLAATAGSNYTYPWTMTNNADKATNFNLVAAINETTLTEGEVKIQLLYANGTILAESTVPIGFNQTARANNVIFAQGETRSGTVEIQFNSSADSATYHLDVKAEPGDFTFTS